MLQQSQIHLVIWIWLGIFFSAVAKEECECVEGYVVCESKGRIYSGQCQGDNRQGYGIHQLTNGNRFEGQFDGGMISGYGVNFLENGDILRGMFSNEKLEGYATYKWSNGQEYRGEYIGGLRDGFGKLDVSDSVSFEGEWKNDAINGIGILTVDGAEIHGKFLDADLIEEIVTISPDIAVGIQFSITQSLIAAQKADEAATKGQEASSEAHVVNPLVYEERVGFDGSVESGESKRVIVPF